MKSKTEFLLWAFFFIFGIIASLIHISFVPVLIIPKTLWGVTLGACIVCSFWNYVEYEYDKRRAR